MINITPTPQVEYIFLRGGGHLMTWGEGTNLTYWCFLGSRDSMILTFSHSTSLKISILDKLGLNIFRLSHQETRFTLCFLIFLWYIWTNIHYYFLAPQNCTSNRPKIRNNKFLGWHLDIMHTFISFYGRPQLITKYKLELKNQTF